MQNKIKKLVVALGVMTSGMLLTSEVQCHMSEAALNCIADGLVSIHGHVKNDVFKGLNRDERDDVTAHLRDHRNKSFGVGSRNKSGQEILDALDEHDHKHEHSKESHHSSSSAPKILKELLK